MKSAPQPHRSRRGIALVVVLACLVLLAGIVLAFFTSVTTDRGAAAEFEESTRVRTVADSAVELIIAQVKQASGDADKAWISQPGLIRTFDTKGEPSAAYKLYSADELMVAGAFDPASDLPPADWNELPGAYTDLNEPIALPDRANPASPPLLQYPIVDPRAAAIDPATGKAEVEGFAFDKPPGTSTNALPMPVKWLYMTKDGTLMKGVAVPGSLKVRVQDASNRQPTKANPIVARLAFWADDETAKVNINTASAGTFWDSPVCNTVPPVDPKDTAYIPDLNRIYESDLADKQGAQREFQRYPGHPATTSLMPIFSRPLARALGTTDRRALVDEIFAMIPRVTSKDPLTGNDYSSAGGTRRGNPPKAAPFNAKLRMDSDRLYASLDEILYAPKLTGTPAERVENRLDETARRRELVEKTKFFLTASSRAPETNVFNKPRVAIWPVHTEEGKRTAFDRLIAFCGTVGAKTDAQPFYFTRQNPMSPSEDFSQRNAQLYKYLQTLTGQPVPGFAGKPFAQKYLADRDQILTQIFDYIRCENLCDVSEGATPYTSGSARGQVVPIEVPNGTRGFGRILSISELALVITGRPREDKDFAGKVYKPDKLTTCLHVALVPEVFCAMAGYSALSNNVKVTFEGLNSLTINGQPVFGRNYGTPGGPVDTHVMYQERIPTGHAELRFGGPIGIQALMEERIDATTALSWPPKGELEVTGSATGTVKQMKIDGGTIRVKIEAPYTAGLGTPVTVQTFEFKFEPATVKIPAQNKRFSEYSRRDDKWPDDTERLGRVRTAGWSNGAYYYNIQGGDTIRSLQPIGSNAQGDWRLIAGKKSPGAHFAKHPDYDTPGTAQAHGFVDGWASPYGGATLGNLVAGISDYDGFSDHHPDVPKGINGVTLTDAAGAKQPGDWDNGQGIMRDGPWLNKVDEGAQSYGALIPYIGDQYSLNYTAPVDPTLFSPNRQMPSSLMFGSQPTGVLRNRPWQTLLFRPARSYLPGGASHPGSAVGGVPDHLLADLFWMPVVEPYPISEPFSTAGKINLNYQIAPFTYIRRDTGLRAVFEAVKIGALDPAVTTQAPQSRLFTKVYKEGGVNLDASNQGRYGARGISVRYNIDATSTLKTFEQRFAANQPFISATEICDVPLVPAGIAGGGDPVAAIESKLSTFWTKNKLTGDNTLERPYALIYPRVTTKSNTYTAYVQVQTLKKVPSTDPAIFDFGKDKVTGDFRGAFIIERFLDPNRQQFDAADPAAVLGPYKFRVVSSKQIGR